MMIPRVGPNPPLWVCIALSVEYCALAAVCIYAIRVIWVERLGRKQKAYGTSGTAAPEATTVSPEVR